MLGLCMNRTTYENDVRALMMAFFPGEKIVLNGEADPYLVRVVFSSVEVQITLEDREKILSKASGQGSFSDYKAGKNVLKRTLYQCLSSFKGYSLPWGTLTGIRPVQIVLNLMDEGKSEAEIYRYLKTEYYISDEKYRLCTRVAKNEKKILKQINYRSTYSLYIGIPFCPTICAYCSFSSYPLAVWKDRVGDYLDALFKELDFVGEIHPKKDLLTIYVGGGTPTSLTASQLDQLLWKLSSLWDLRKLKEITIESGRPDSLSREKLRVMKAYGIDRISINPQSMKQETLQRIGRKHTVEQVKEAFYMAREEGFQDINMDLIAGLPKETPADMEDTLAQIEELRPDSMTVHSLAIKRAAYLNQNREEFPLTPQEEVNQMIETSFASALRMGMEPYYLYRQKNIAGNLENVGYAHPGKAGLYNIMTMGEKQTIVGVGANASTKIVIPGQNRIERVENVKNVKDYLERVDEMIDRKKKSELLQNLDAV